MTDAILMTLPVLAFITGDTLSSRVKEFLDSSGRPFVEKPLTPAEVQALYEASL